MQILIEIPNPPKRQEIVDIPLHFIDGDICEAGGYEFKVLSPHGRLIDGDEVMKKLQADKREAFTKHDVWLMLSKYGAPTILEAEE